VSPESLAYSRAEKRNEKKRLGSMKNPNFPDALRREGGAKRIGGPEIKECRGGEAKCQTLLSQSRV